MDILIKVLVGIAEEILYVLMVNIERIVRSVMVEPCAYIKPGKTGVAFVEMVLTFVSICEHKIRRTRCIECNFSGFLKDRVSSRINKALKKNKMSSSIEYLGCDIDTFKTHLETKFLEGMDWKNYGSVWHIDHIIPVAYKKPTTEEVIKRLHYTNTQPLWALDNISKGNRYIG